MHKEKLGIWIVKGTKPHVKDISKPIHVSILVVSKNQSVTPEFQISFSKKVQSNRDFRYNSYQKNRHKFHKENRFQ